MILGHLAGKEGAFRGIERGAWVRRRKGGYLRGMGGHSRDKEVI